MGQRRLPDLTVRWSKRERDIVYNWTAHEGGKNNGHYLHHILGGEVQKELERRGFDLTTLRFSIARKPGLEGCRECHRWPHQDFCSKADKPGE